MAVAEEVQGAVEGKVEMTRAEVTELEALRQFKKEVESSKGQS